MTWYLTGIAVATLVLFEIKFLFWALQYDNIHERPFIWGVSPVQVVFVLALACAGPFAAVPAAIVGLLSVIFFLIGVVFTKKFQSSTKGSWWFEPIGGDFVVEFKKRKGEE